MWLRNGVRVLRDSEALLVAGQVQVVLRRTRPNAVEYFGACLCLDQEENVAVGHHGVTANVFVKRDLLERYERFRQDLQSGGDVEFGRRLTRAAEKLVNAPDAVVFHPARSTLRSYVAKEKRISLGHRNLRDLGIIDGYGITWRSFVRWARVPHVEGIRLTAGQKAGVCALLICAKYFRLAYKLTPSSLVLGKHPDSGFKA